ncbi:hypothetical protein V9L05_15270 [Bernardetia sp. Wsw4-3y2]|uniref:DUF3560 domain-containing protein n=1 Tax=Bernardetia sp. Wsw4-3y2 TaxID=3127471 RepID=UPI0030CEB32F
MRTYTINADSKAVLNFDKSDYTNLSREEKQEIKKYFLFSRWSKAWVSKGKYINYSVQEVIKKFNFEFKGKEEVRTFEESLEKKIERAENRVERFEQYAKNATKRAEILQSDFNKYRKDWSWLTQPYMNTSGGRSFRNHKEGVMRRYDKGFEEYKKSDYFLDRAATSQETAQQNQYLDPIYIQRQLIKVDKEIKDLEKYLPKASETINKIEEEEQKEKKLLRLEFFFDSLKRKNQEKAFLLVKLNELIENGVKVFDKKTLKNAFYIKSRGVWRKVKSVNQKTVTYLSYGKYYAKVPILEITDAVYKGDVFKIETHHLQDAFIITRMETPPIF